MQKLLKVIRFIVLLIISFLLFVAVVDKFYPISLAKVQDSSKLLFDKDGKLLYASLNSEDKWRFKSDLKDIDPLFIKMLIAFEDKKFYSHKGVDFLALLRASYQLIKYQKVVSGASTITMQLAKLLEPKKRTFANKIVEIMRAIELEWHLSKQNILQDYLTLAPYGGNIESLAAASYYYFGKLPRNLSASEAALLVALPKNPNGYNPFRHPKKALQARARVLKRALDMGIIDKTSYLQALNAPLPKKPFAFPRYAYFVAKRLLKKQKQVKTTLSLPLQKALEVWAKDVALSLPNDATLALLVVENNSSKVRAYIGNGALFSKERAGYIDLMHAKFSPGSTLKPFIYALALEDGLIHQNSIIKDNEVRFGSYHPSNYSKKYHGDVSVIFALQNSLNIPAVKVLNRLNPNYFLARLQKVVGEVKLPFKRANLSIALGGVGISLWQLTQGYLTLANAKEAKSLVLASNQEQKKLFFVSNKSAQVIGAILSDITPPPPYELMRGKIAFKTGTSYGFRDFWTLGFSKNYTLGLLIAKANNEPIIKNSAREIATPLFFEAFRIIDSIAGVKYLHYSNKILTQKAPPLLQYFEKENRKFDFLFPKENAKYASEGCHKTNVKVKVSGGKAPYYWYIDGEAKGNLGDTFVLKFDSGAHTLSVIDANNKIISRHIWIEESECE